MDGGSGGLVVDEFLTAQIVRQGLCLHPEVTDRIRLGSLEEMCLGASCPLRRLCLSRALRRHLDGVPARPDLRALFEVALCEMGNGP